jgi:hypothetical protein
MEHDEELVAAEVQNYLTQVEALRQECERRGDFRKAQECVDRMREVNRRYARRVEAVSKRTNVAERAQLAEEHQAELLTFARVWDDKMSDYEGQAQRVLDELLARHSADYASQEGLLKIHLMNRRPHFSRKVQELRDRLERCVARRAYLEAEDLKRVLAEHEQREIAAFDASLAEEFQNRTATMKTQYVNEVRAVKQRVENAREELRQQRKQEFEKVIRRHANAMRDLEGATRLHISKTRHYVEKQMVALEQDPVKTALELRSMHTHAGRARSSAARTTRGQSSRSPAATARGGHFADPTTGWSPEAVGSASLQRFGW